MIGILHINDNRVLVQTENGLTTSQGYALIENGNIEFDIDGAAPISQCRLRPQQINNHYWQQCAKSSIPGNHSGLRYSADIVYKHVAALQQKHDLRKLVLVVPSHYQQSNLQILLGIFKACNIEVLGVLNKAVAQMMNKELGTETLHVDVQLHQTVFSRVVVKNAERQLDSVEVSQDVGIQSMQDMLLHRLQSSFIQNTRFDPLHHAATEQQLFDQLQQAGAFLRQDNKFEFRVEHQSQSHHISIDRAEWDLALQPAYEKLSERVQQLNATGQSTYVDFNCFDAIIDVDEHLNIINADAVLPIQDYVDLFSHRDGIVYLTSVANESSTQEQKGEARRTSQVTDVANKKPSVGTKVKGEVSQEVSASHLVLDGVGVDIRQAVVKIDDGSIRLFEAAQSNLDEMIASGKLYIFNAEQRQELQLNDRICSQYADGVINVIGVRGE